jgi:hypothetical protein
MKFGKYKVNFSVNISEEIFDLNQFFTKEEWEAFTEEDQQQTLYDSTYDIIMQGLEVLPEFLGEGEEEERNEEGGY